jgi:hypothetical protein
MTGSEITTAEAAIHGVARSPHWPMAEHHCLAANPCCAASGVKTGLQVHHVAPFHFCILVGRPDLELDSRNFVVLSESEQGLAQTNYHLLLGHAGFFQSSNLNVREDTTYFYCRAAKEIEDSSLYQARVRNRCKPWNSWSDMDKQEFRTYLDNLYPLPVGVTPEVQVELLVASIKAIKSSKA